MRLLIFTCAVVAGLTGSVWAGECNRKFFGNDWKISGRQNVRHHLLESQSLTPAELKDDGKRIYVTKGSWEDEMTGVGYRYVDPAGLLEIDHVIPIAWACKHGAEKWAWPKRRAFYNDSRLLIITTKYQNGVKGGLGADVYLPTDRDNACEYITTFQWGIIEYDLEVSALENTLMNGHDKDACR